MGLGDFNEDGLLTRKEFEHAARILVHDDEHALTSHSFDSLNYDSNDVLDEEELNRLQESYADQA